MSYRVINAFITPNKFSRPQIQLKKIKAIVIHYVANTNTSAIANRNFFDNRKDGNSGFGSAHEIIGINGDILVCVPDNEITYNCGSKTYTERCLKELGKNPNYSTYGIECTHIKDDGTMSENTYNTLVERCYDLCKKYKLNSENLWLHKEVVGWKPCHKWFVLNPAEWAKFKAIVQKKLDNEVKMEVVKAINKEVEMMFKDFETVSDYAKPAVEKLEKLNIFKGDESDNFNPQKSVSRQELAVVIDRVLKLFGK